MAENQKELGPEDFEKLAAELDSKGSVEIPDEPSAQSEEQPESESHDDAEVEVKPADSSEGEKPKEDEVPERKSETREESEYSRAAKDKERLDRNWQKQQELADQVRREREQLEREKAEWKQQQQAAKPPGSDKDESGYSAEDYERGYEQFLLEGNKEMAEEAKTRALNLRKATHQRLWNEHLDTVKKENPGIEKDDHPLHAASLKVLRDIPILNMAPDGAKHAVRIAKAENSLSLISGLQAENKQLKSEIKRLNESMELGGSGPMRIPSDKAFEDMSTKEQEKELARMAEELDRMGMA